jgi:hypothetical protein
MSHDTHDKTGENKTIVSFKNSFWLVIIIVGLFIAALNFVQAESGGETEGPGGGKIEATGHEAETKTHDAANTEHHPEAAPATTPPADSVHGEK